MLIVLISTKQKVKLKLLKYLLQMTNGTLMAFMTGNNRRSSKSEKEAYCLQTVTVAPIHHFGVLWIHYWCRLWMTTKLGVRLQTALTCKSRNKKYFIRQLSSSTHQNYPTRRQSQQTEVYILNKNPLSMRCYNQININYRWTFEERCIN